MSSQKVDEDRHGGRINQAISQQARIQNPLYGIPKNVLMAQVEAFTREKGMEDVESMFKKGALLAQNPKDFESIPELDEADRAIIRRETTHKWSQPKSLYMTVVVCSFAAAVQGWDQTGSGGANLSFAQEFNINTVSTDPDAARNQWIVSLINSAPYFGSSFIGCWLTDPLNHYLGRRGTLFFCGIFFTFTILGSGFAQTWPQLLICHLLLGLAMGPNASTAPIFATENVPANIRGGLVMSTQMWTALGIVLGYTTNIALEDVGRIAWRLDLASAMLPAIPVTIGIYFCPESPRWLMKKGRYHAAYQSFKRLRNSELQAARDMYYVHLQLVEEFRVLKGSTYRGRLVQLFTIPRIRRAALASFVVMIAQQMCGFTFVAFYSSTIFLEAGYSRKQALQATCGFFLINWLFAFPAIWTIDTFGRRNLLLFTFPNMAWTLLAAGLSISIPKTNFARLPLVTFFIYLYAAFYSPGEGPVPSTYSAEVFPLTHREIGMAWSVALCLFWSGVVSITFPRIVGAFGSTGAFGVYAGMSVCALILIFFLVPETKQRTLEELDYVFAVPISHHASYQLNTWLPYFFKRYILFQKSATLTPLYNFEEAKSIPVFENRVGH